MSIDDWRRKLTSNGLRVTPQRLAVMEAFSKLKDHPSADRIILNVHENHPNIASGTVYKILDILVEKGIIRKVKTDRDFVRYDAITETHHHLYTADSEKMEDYFDDELDTILKNYFAKRHIPGFTIEEIKLQIKGKFDS
jgi:Fur family peroxide stress response transcriptional regulator